jgi:hypothetical protein
MVVGVIRAKPGFATVFSRRPGSFYFCLPPLFVFERTILKRLMRGEEAPKNESAFVTRCLSRPGASRWSSLGHRHRSSQGTGHRYFLRGKRARRCREEDRKRILLEEDAPAPRSSTELSIDNPARGRSRACFAKKKEDEIKGDRLSLFRADFLTFSDFSRKEIRKTQKGLHIVLLFAQLFFSEQLGEVVSAGLSASVLFGGSRVTRRRKGAFHRGRGPGGSEPASQIVPHIRYEGRPVRPPRDASPVSLLLLLLYASLLLLLLLLLFVFRPLLPLLPLCADTSLVAVWNRTEPHRAPASSAWPTPGRASGSRSWSPTSSPTSGG